MLRPVAGPASSTPHCPSEPTVAVILAVIASNRFQATNCTLHLPHEEAAWFAAYLDAYLNGTQELGAFFGSLKASSGWVCVNAVFRIWRLAFIRYIRQHIYKQAASSRPRCSATDSCAHRPRQGDVLLA